MLFSMLLEVYNHLYRPKHYHVALASLDGWSACSVFP